MRGAARTTLPLIVLVALCASGSAQEAPYGDTYTDDELAALDRALEAGNLRRSDLTFDKAVTKGHGVLPLVRTMLGDSLRIAPAMDDAADALGTASPMLVLARAQALLGDVSDDLASEFDVAGARILFVDEMRVPSWLDVASPDSLAASLAGVAARQPPLRLAASESSDAPDLLLDALRAKLPAAMAWHDVFASPYADERQEAIDAWVATAGPEALHEAAARLKTAPLWDVYVKSFGEPAEWLALLPPGAFPEKTPLVLETAHGRVALGTRGDDTYTGDFTILIDPGGDDRYVDCRIGAAFGTEGRRLGFFADLGGDDVYDCGDVNITLGAAVLGVAAFYDVGAGNDRYVGGHASLGAAIGGMAVFYDDGGTDTYDGRTFTQGAAGFGIGVFLDGSTQPRPETSTDEGTKEPVEIALFDNDRLNAWGSAQGFARARAVALCINHRGNDTYEAGGVYLHAPLFSDRYQSFSQGFAIGERGIDWAGGIAMLIDGDGNDRYLGDIYNQGVGYWYGAGLLWDGGGNDTYEMTQYGQGSGIHLAIGGLVDVAGSDTYVMHSGLGQGGSHDYAASILHDRAGSDRYHGSTSCNGCGLTNSVGIHIDRAGNDLYAARKKGGWNSGRPARDFSSIGVLVDLAGVDNYMEVGANGGAWRIRDIGLGIDVEQPDDTPSAGNTPGAGQTPGNAEMPKVVSYEGELTEKVFDELWEIAVRWEVGDNRLIVPEARKRLIAFGPAVLPLMDGKVETDNSGLELRAFSGVLRGLADAGARDDVLAFLRKNAVAESERRKRVALHLIGELKTPEVEEAIVAILGGSDATLARRAADALAKIGSHAGDELLVSWLATGDARRVQTAVGVLVRGGADCWDALAPLLDHDDFAVRTRLLTMLGKHLPKYRPGVLAALDAKGPLRVRRCALDVLVRAKALPDATTIAAVHPLLASSDPWLRADAARVVRRWQGLEGVDADAIAESVAVVDGLARDDASAFVRSAARTE